jgi:hypothetical protein
MLDLQTKIILTGKLELIDLAGEPAIFDFESGNYCTLKGSADAVWEYLGDGVTVAEISEALIKEYEIDMDTCVSAISDFLYALKEQNFIGLAQP